VDGRRRHTAYSHNSASYKETTAVQIYPDGGSDWTALKRMAWRMALFVVGEANLWRLGFGICFQSI
jgi:hypothetical protein